MVGKTPAALAETFASTHRHLSTVTTGKCATTRTAGTGMYSLEGERTITAPAAPGVTCLLRTLLRCHHTVCLHADDDGT